MDELVLERKLLKSGIPKKFWGKGLNDFIIDGNEKTLDKALEYTEYYVNNLDENIKNGKGIIFIGNVGTGKTHLVCAIAQIALQKNYSVRFFPTVDLLNRIKESFDDTNIRKELQGIEDVDIFILDDFASEVVTPWVRERMFGIVNYRYNSLKPLLLTSNVTLEEIEKLYLNTGEKLISRIKEEKLNTIVPTIRAKSFREKK